MYFCNILLGLNLDVYKIKIYNNMLYMKSLCCVNNWIYIKNIYLFMCCVIGKSMSSLWASQQCSELYPIVYSAPKLVYVNIFDA